MIQHRAKSYRGTLCGRDESWWRAHGRIEWLNPFTINLYGTPVNEAHVEAYRKDPDRAPVTSDLPPCVARGPAGDAWMHDGKHRCLAARRERRRLKCLVADEPRPAQ